MTNQATLTAKCAQALLNNMAEHGFSPSLTYRARSHAYNNKAVEAAHCDMLATIAIHKQGGVSADDAAALGLRVRAVGRVRSRDAMSWMVDDLLNYLQGLVDAGTVVEEAPAEAAPEWVYFVNIGTTDTLRRYDANNHAAKSQYRAPRMNWRDSTMTGSGALQKLAEGAAVLCNEFGSALPATPDEPEATDPVTGFTYRVAKDGGILSKPAGGSTFCAAVCSTRTIQTLIRLGLVSVA